MRHPPASAVIALVVLVLVLVPHASPAQTPATPLRGLDAFIEKGMADWGVVGLSVAIVEDDSVVYARGFGVRDVRTRQPVTPNTLFAIGSNTKLFTAVAAGMLVDDGRLSFDDPATKHVPGFQLYDPYVTREMTIRDLMSHRSGLGRRGDQIWYGTDFDRAEVIRRIRHLEPNSSFRAAYGYQNVMFLTAGEAIASAAGMSWDDFIDRRIFEPLGMRTSNTSVKALGAAADVAAPHSWRPGGAVAVPWRDIDNVAPAGSINSSALEMAQWLRMLLDEGTYGGRELIEAATLREITSPHTITGAGGDTLFPSTHFSAYGLGIGMRDYLGHKVLAHTGGIDGMLSLVAMVPERELGLVVLTNTDGRNALFSAIMYRVLDAYLGGPERDWSALLLQQTEAGFQQAAQARKRQEESRAKATAPSHALDAYVGTFRSPLYGDAVIRVEGGRLAIRRAAMEGLLEHWHYNTFALPETVAVGPRSLLTFRVDAGGKVASFVIDLQGEAVFTRVDEK